MLADPQGWHLELPLAEVGYFKAKAYLVDPDGWQHWPEGLDFGLSVHPDRYRTANVLYCAFPRMFGASRTSKVTTDEAVSRSIKPLDAGGYAVIPPSGKLRDLVQFLPHIFKDLGCRILHLLPIHPTPTTYARFGRFGSPYAALDLTGVDPALVVFDKHTTGIDQFRELTYTTHSHGGRVFLDIVINHTGWGSALQEDHPEWFVRQDDGGFISPGAWGVTWEDLVELNQSNVPLWDKLSDMFLIWCRRGVDGFRCDAGYKVPVAAWQYIVARVQQEFPETVFLLEGLGGSWEITEALLTEGGMQWAYSELFQNYSGLQVSGYLDHSLRQSARAGLLIHYSETHDNERLAAKGKNWSLLRNHLCALTSVSGGFGFTCGVEWLATEKILVHGSTGMAWDNSENVVAELAKLGQLLAEHPCFFDGARLTRLSSPESSVYALLRQSLEGKDVVLVLINTDMERANDLVLDPGAFSRATESLIAEKRRAAKTDLSLWIGLLGQVAPAWKDTKDGKWSCTLRAGAAFCLAPSAAPNGLSGQSYRLARSQAAWGLNALSRLVPAEQIGKFEWQVLAEQVNRSPGRFLAAVSHFAAQVSSQPPPTGSALLHGALESVESWRTLPHVFVWTLLDLNRITVVPPNHWLLVEDSVPFRATLAAENGDENVESIQVTTGNIACFAPRQTGLEATLQLERYGDGPKHVEGPIWFLPPCPQLDGPQTRPRNPTDLVLLTNGRGGMARICVDLGRVLSKYDCVLGANLHPTLPVDRHVLAKRIRVWVNADGFISPLDFRSTVAFQRGPPAIWHFVANAGDGRTVEIQMSACMIEGQNTTVFKFSRPTAEQATGKQLPAAADVRLTVRLDIEDRGFHSETKRNGGADYHFSSHARPIDEIGDQSRSASKQVGFTFTPASDRMLRVVADAGVYHPQPEWSVNIPHPIEQSRGQVGAGDAFSPGWFELPLTKGATLTLVVTAEPGGAKNVSPQVARQRSQTENDNLETAEDAFLSQLQKAVQAFVVQRGSGKTVIAGYPWFLDWGRDTFICARGLLAAGMAADVKQIVLTFARFEKEGTLPNTIFGEDASNRDTSDAPLWFGIVCEELGQVIGPIDSVPVDGNRTIGQVLESIALHYVRGTPNRIRMDPGSALIWSPSHFTWMDTNYPACTPREGYPIEIQALWIRLLQQLQRIGSPDKREYWKKLAAQALASLQKMFWLEERGYFADVLLAAPQQGATNAAADNALRSNCLLVVSLGLAKGEQAKRCVDSAARFLVIPGALRSLAPLPVKIPLPNRSNDGHLLNDPKQPYWGHYEGDEDSRRKPAYHNGTAWTWTFPIFCEALARAWDFSAESTEAAKAYLGSMAKLLDETCLGQLPEILDGDAPHLQRGCDAQAWGATEALRVWKLLQNCHSP
jgi:predicted glycogen debranching enzyme